jgi:hypothetical protein
MNKLIKLSDLVALAELRGFKVRSGSTQAELWYPENVGPTAVWHDGGCYSTCDILLSSNPDIGYGYNSAFHGPYHHGYVHADSYGARKFLSHVS